MSLAEDIDTAADHLARQVKVVVHLSLTRFDLKNKEAVHGSAPVAVEWMVCLHGRHELKAQMADTPWNKKNLKVDAGTPLEATLNVSLVDYLDHHHGFKTLTMAHSTTQTEPKDELFICDQSNSNMWRVALTYTNSVLSSVALVHDSTEHQELTDYLHEVAKLKIKHELAFLCSKQQS